MGTDASDPATSDRDDGRRQYNRGDLTVAWEPSKCVHSGICFAGLGGVFNPKRRPWVDLSQAAADQVVAQVKECPSGALRVFHADEPPTPPEGTPAAHSVQVTADGPLLVSGPLSVQHADGTRSSHDALTAFCRCGNSGRKPFCDGSHARTGFKG